MEHILSNIPPFCLHENIYFVGSSRVSVHLIQTEKGLLLIDTGYPDMLDKAAVFSALQLYIDFINLFLRLLRYVGRRRD